MDPTPPPEVVALTRFTFTEKGKGSDALDKMWVTSVRRVGPALMCDGWLVRYPYDAQPSSGGPNGTQISIGGSSGRPATLPPVIEAHASMACNERGLVPFGPSPVPSP
jgi:hypothetical protein